jgi:hypothetical protein
VEHFNYLPKLQLGVSVSKFQMESLMWLINNRP